MKNNQSLKVGDKNLPIYEMHFEGCPYQLWIFLPDLATQLKLQPFQVLRDYIVLSLRKVKGSPSLFLAKSVKLDTMASKSEEVAIEMFYGSLKDNEGHKRISDTWWARGRVLVPLEWVTEVTQIRGD